MKLDDKGYPDSTLQQRTSHELGVWVELYTRIENVKYSWNIFHKILNFESFNE